MKSFILDSKDLFNKKKNLKLSPRAGEILKNKKIKKKYLYEIRYKIKPRIYQYVKEESEQGLLKELSNDVYGYDLRNWDERGISEEAIKERYGNGNKNFPLVSASRYFTCVFPTLRNGCKTGVEKIVETIMASREKNWKELEKCWLSNLKQGLKQYFNDPEDVNKDHLIELYAEYVRYCVVLDHKPLSKRQIYDSVKMK